VSFVCCCVHVSCFLSLGAGAAVAGWCAHDASYTGARGGWGRRATDPVADGAIAFSMTMAS
jgi:hypothetical protein